MSSTADRAVARPLDAAASSPTFARAEGLELLGELDGSGYERGAALVRRADGQMVQVGPLLYALLGELDGRRDTRALAEAMTTRLGRSCDEEHVEAIAHKLEEQGLLAGSESNAPERSNPLLALRWKVIVTDPKLTRRLTRPFTVLYRPWVLVPVLAAFVAVCWFVLVEQGVAAAAAQAFDRPELILLVFALGIASAGFHELGHATACRYGGGTPGAMGAGIYLVWPAFYTDVTDAYRLPRRDRLRTDLGGLYFNAIVAVATIGVWLALRVDALLLLVGLQLVEMVKQLSPVIRADGYHVLADATGVPDLYAHIGPTLRRLIPGQPRAASALTGRARWLVTGWVLVVVPVLLALALSAVLLLPKLAASTWVSGSQLLDAMPDQARDGDVIDLLVSMLRLLALLLPTMGALLIAHRLIGGTVRRAASWSRGRPARRALVAVLAIGAALLMAWAWWPSGQYEPIRASDRGTLRDVPRLLAAPAASSSPQSTPVAGTAERTSNADAKPTLPPGTHVAIGLIPEGGASDDEPAVFVITDPERDAAPVVIATNTAPDPGESTSDAPSSEPTETTATAFDFALPDAPREQDTQALAVNREDGSVVYRIAYSLVTVRDGAAVDEENGAYAFANCEACATVAVSFQVVLVVGSSPMVAPINIAEALNGNCPRCVTLAIANQIVVSVGEEPSQELLDRLNAELARLDAIDDLGADTTPEAIAQQVTAVQAGINQILDESGIRASDQAQDTTATDPADATDPTNPADPATTTDTTDATTDTTPSDATTDPATDTTTTTTTADPATTSG